jgi:hypothetical protein
MVQTAPPVSLEPSILQTFVGRYRFATSPPGRVTVVSMEAGKLTVRIPGRPKKSLTPTAETEFFDGSAGNWNVHRGQDGKVTDMVRRRRGVDYRAEKIE